MSRPRNLVSSLDGIDHINVYSQARTELGRFLSNFSRVPIVTSDGPFESIEGYWYWLGTTHPDRDQLRKLFGYEAKEVGRMLRSPDWPDVPNFHEKILLAIREKIMAVPQMSEAFTQSRLPFCHYYVYGGKIVKVPKSNWILEGLESLRKEMAEKNRTDQSADPKI